MAINMSSKNHSLNKNCRWCDNYFTPSKSGKPQIYCTNRCKKEFEKNIRILGLEFWEFLGQLDTKEKNKITLADVLNELCR